MTAHEEPEPAPAPLRRGPAPLRPSLEHRRRGPAADRGHAGVAGPHRGRARTDRVRPTLSPHVARGQCARTRRNRHGRLAADGAARAGALAGRVPGVDRELVERMVAAVDEIGALTGPEGVRATALASMRTLGETAALISPRLKQRR